MKNSFARRPQIFGYLLRPVLTLALIGSVGIALFAAPPLTYAQTSPSWSLTGSLNSSRVEPTATLLPNGKVLVVGGGLNTAELYDPVTGTWSFTANLVVPRFRHTATLLPNGKVMVVGGYDDNTGFIASAELYDPATGTWSATGSLNEGRGWHTATLLQNGKVLVVGGAGDSDLYSAELYDPATETWSVTGNMHDLRFGHSATLLQSGQVLVAGGSPDDFLTYENTAELYDPATGTWSVTGSLHQARVLSTATLLPDGKILLAGGVSYVPSGGGFAPQPSNSAELYDPATGTWSVAANLKTARTDHTATLLPSGKVLVAGGRYWVPPCPCPFNDLNSAELYDPTSGTWKGTAKLKIARAFHTATLLDSGNVLVATGDPHGDNSAEIYNDGRSLELPESRLPNAEAGVAYTAPLVNDGIAPYLMRFLKSALPEGLAFDAGSGTISGTPTSSMNRTFKVQITDQTGLSGIGTFTIKILRALLIKSSALKAGINGKAYRTTLSAVGGDKPYQWSLVSGNLPSGLALDSSTGVVTGTPTESGAFNLRFRLSDPIGGAAEKDVSITIR